MDLKTCEKCSGTIAPDSPSGMCPKCLLQLAKSEQTIDRQPADLQPPKPQQIAELFPELEILDVIGHGGMGYVYKARQKNLGRIVAVKILSSNLLDDPTFAERFSREARAMAMMNHPNIIAIYDFGCRNNNYFLVMEYVDGLNLRQVVTGAGLQPAEAMQLVPQLCDALQYAHDRGVVHRDIKPENVLISQEGQVKIADFGLAKLTNQQHNLTLTQTQQVMGTPNYMAPEQREKPVDVDHRADIYSLGVVIYELLTGELPLGRFAPPSQKVQVDVRLDDVVMRALEKDPSLRFQHVSELKTGIETASVSGANVGGAPVKQPVHQNVYHQSVHTQAVVSANSNKMWSFLIMSGAILVGIGGILLIICSGIAEDFESNTFLGQTFGNENVLRIMGFVGLASCGAIFAMYGIYTSVFHPAPENSSESLSNPGATVSTNSQPKRKPTPVLVLTGLGTVCGFVCAWFFIIGSSIPGVSGWQAGIACALIAGCMYSLAELVEKAYDPSKESEDSLAQLVDLGNPPCPKCGKELKSPNAKQCFACGHDWH